MKCPVCSSEVKELYNLNTETDEFKCFGCQLTDLDRRVRRLERQGLINISSGKDHRTRIITITSKGTNSIANAIPLWNEIQRKVKQQMGEKAWHELIQSLSQFVKVAERLLPPDKN